MRQPKIKLVILPFFRLAPPLGAACMHAYLKRFGFSLECLDLRLRKNDITTYAELTPQTNFAMDIPDLPLILTLIRNDASGADLLSGFDEVLAEYVKTRPLSYLQLKKDIQDLYRLAEEAAPQLATADIVAFTTYRSNFFATVLCALLARRLNREGVFAFGGPQISQSDNARKIALKGGACDIAVIGEGEIPLLEIARAWCEGRPPAASGSVTYDRERDRFVASPAKELDLSELPCPDFSCMDVQSYPMVPFVNDLPLYSSRGCPFRCSFCNEGRMWSSFRRLPVETVIHNMKELNRKHGTTSFSFADSLLNSSLPWLDEFCGQLLAQDLDFNWDGYFRANVTRDLADSMKKAGLAGAFIGAESFDGDMLLQMNKKREVADNVQAIEDFMAKGILLQISNVAGFPGETEEMFRRHWRFLLELTRKYPALCFFNIESFQLSPGSDVYEQPQKYGLSVDMWGERVADLVPDLREIVLHIPMTVSYSPSPAVTSYRYSLLLNNFKRDAVTQQEMRRTSLAPLLKTGVRKIQPEDTVQILNGKSLTLEPGKVNGQYLIKSGSRELYATDLTGKAIFGLLDGKTRVREISATLPAANKKSEKRRLEMIEEFLENLIDAGILIGVQRETDGPVLH